MTSEEAKELLNQLKNGQLEEVYVNQADFLTFRSEFAKRSDKKEFRGIAQRNGDVIYKYEPGWTA
ncbi:hypothetical protein [Heyndrickxia camelliae]|uniref:Uncharacterized protein n=1 Tax=Heyndrickxia camelliae TaxID=1707093 RepID=A0A2N3LM98_9BACI|nr:hypothetical protein [Heyndrickxia camelliae]PKR85782.1 hypothetical protein CWO92_05225 [Heyndrickxia camelliae]